MDTDILQHILGLPQLRIDEIEVQETRMDLHVQCDTECGICPRCHTGSWEVHEHLPVRVIRDLPLSGKACYLHVHRRRFWCPVGDQAFAEPIEWVEPYRHATCRYEALLYERVRRNTVSAVAGLEGLSYDQVEGAFLCEVVRRLPEEPLRGVQRLGIDEIAEHKGQKSYDLLFYDADTGEPVERLEGRTKAQLIAYFAALPPEVKAGIDEVCIDLWRPYAQAIGQELSAAVLGVDRFHVMKSVTGDLKALKNARKADLPEEAKACHDALLKNQDTLTAPQQTTLDAVYQADPILKRAHQLKEQFRAIFETSQTIKEARKAVQRWIAKAYKHQLFPTVITLMKTWLSPILNYFRSRTTNGPAEGANNRVKLIKRQAYGMRNFAHFRLRVLGTFF
jgi:transposase